MCRPTSEVTALTSWEFVVVDLSEINQGDYPCKAADSLSQVQPAQTMRFLGKIPDTTRQFMLDELEIWHELRGEWNWYHLCPNQEEYIDVIKSLAKGNWRPSNPDGFRKCFHSFTKKSELALEEVIEKFKKDLEER